MKTVTLRFVLKMDVLEMDTEEISTWRHEFIRFCRNTQQYVGEESFTAINLKPVVLRYSSVLLSNLIFIKIFIFISVLHQIRNKSKNTIGRHNYGMLS